MVHGLQLRNSTGISIQNFMNLMQQFLLMAKNFILQATGTEESEIWIFMSPKKMRSGDWGPAVNLGD